MMAFLNGAVWCTGLLSIAAAVVFFWFVLTAWLIDRYLDRTGYRTHFLAFMLEQWRQRRESRQWNEGARGRD